MRFDWYSATVPTYPEALVKGIRESMLGIADSVERKDGTNNYQHMDVVTDAMGERICAVLHGGSNGSPHVRASGVYSPHVADVLRRLWPGHAVSRADVAIDFDGPGCWAKLYRVAEDTARHRGLKWCTYGDFRDDRDEASGRTAYIGSRQSKVMVRLYEKGKQVAPTLKVGEPAVSPDWCRLEVEVKPQAREARLAASTWPAKQFWGCSTWSRALLFRVAAEDVRRITMTVRKETDAKRAIRHMAIQYRQAMETVIQEEGSDAALLRFIREVWNESDRIHRQAA